MGKWSRKHVQKRSYIQVVISTTLEQTKNERREAHPVIMVVLGGGETMDVVVFCFIFSLYFPNFLVRPYYFYN